MKYDFAVKNARIVTDKEIFSGEIYVKDEKIAAVTLCGAELETSESIDADGKYLMPGIIDPHVHGGYGTPERETFECAGMAAAAGGITTILEQPLSEPSTVTEKAFLDKKAEAEKSFVVDFGLWGGLTPGHIDEMERIFRLGGGAFKSFMCRCSNYAQTDDGTLIEGLKALSNFGGLNAVHAENDMMIQVLSEKLSGEKKDGIEIFLKSHPVYSELEAILRYIFILKQVPGSKGHIVHCSIPEGIRAVCEAKLSGVDITAETCPQYLGLCEDDLRRIGGTAKCDPPVRSKECVEKLWDCVKAGMVDMIASDHSPHPFGRKNLPAERFGEASEGVTGLQTMLPVILTEGVAKRGVHLTDVVRMMSLNPALRFGLYGRKGAISSGFDADFIIVDLEKEWECRAEDMYYLNRHTPYDGRVFRGYVSEVYVRGNLVCRDGKIMAEPGFGRYYPMEMCSHATEI